MSQALGTRARAAIIVGLAGERLGNEEVELLRSFRPAGVILFARNCKSHAQIIDLLDDVFLAIADDDVLVLIDQEGGRVQRLRPPLGRALPPARAYGRLYARDPQEALKAAFDVHRLMAHDLGLLNINTDCLPVLDVPVPGAHDVIGDRAFGTDPGVIAHLGSAAARGLMAGGVLPVMKHIPGHGRSLCDSHHELPRVDENRSVLEQTDFKPFRDLNDLPAAMTAHVVYEALDPEAPASTSRMVTQEIIRGHIGFDGLLMSDDLSMKALSGSMTERAAGVIAAGCDVALHCNGDHAEMLEAVNAVPALEADAKRRFDACMRIAGRRGEPFDEAEAEATLARLMDIAAGGAESV